MRRTNGRVLIMAPVDLQDEPEDTVDRKALTAIASAFLWQAQIDNGQYRSVRALAAAKGIHPSYAWKIIKLALLDPFIIRQLLDGRQPSGFSICKLMRGFPLKWEDQRRVFGFSQPKVR